MSKSVVYRERRINLEDMDRHELDQLHRCLERQAVAQSAELDEARQRARITGQYADPGWYEGTKRRLKQTKWDIYAVGVEQARRDDRPPPQRPDAYSRTATMLCDCFVDVARDRLDPIVFNSILDAAEVAYSAAKRRSDPGDGRGRRPH